MQIVGNLEKSSTLFHFVQSQACLRVEGHFQHLLQHVVTYIHIYIFFIYRHVTPLSLMCLASVVQLNAPYFIQIQPVQAQETHSSVCL